MCTVPWQDRPSQGAAHAQLVTIPGGRSVRRRARVERHMNALILRARWHYRVARGKVARSSLKGASDAAIGMRSGVADCKSGRLSSPRL
jgi:hypothetical protein